MKNKRGAEITIGTIIIIILALVVLVFLIVGFSSGWSNLWTSITNFGGGKANIDKIALACQTACSTQSNYDFCQNPRTIVFSDNVKVEGLACVHLAASKLSGFEDCPALTCNPSSYCDSVKNPSEGTEGTCAKVNCKFSPATNTAAAKCTLN